MNNNRFWEKKNILGLGIIAIIVILSLIKLIINPKPFDPLKLPSPMVTYEGNHVPFVLQYPERWSLSETPKGNHGDKEVIAVINVLVPTVVISRKTMESPNIDSAVAWGMERASRCENFLVTSQQGYETAFTTGVQLNYTCSLYISAFSQEKETCPCRDYYTISETYAYQLTFCATEAQWIEVEEVFDTMIESFYIGDN